MNKQYPYDVPTNYTFDPTKIEVAGGIARLKSDTWTSASDPLITGLSKMVYFNSEIYALSSTRVSKWNGTAWVISLDDTSFQMQDIIVYNNTIQVVGNKTLPNGSGAAQVWKFDGNVWAFMRNTAPGNSGFVNHNGHTYFSNGIDLNGWDVLGNNLWNLGNVFIEPEGMVSLNNLIYFVTNSGAFSSFSETLGVTSLPGLPSGGKLMRVYNNIVYVAVNGSALYKFVAGVWTVALTEPNITAMKEENGIFYIATNTQVLAYDGITANDTAFPSPTPGIGDFVKTATGFFSGVSASGLWLLGTALATDKPTIEPTALFSQPGIASWDIFSEALGAGNQGSVGYNLYKGDKLNKYYWNGTAWVTGGSSVNFNTLATVQANIASFDVNPSSIGYLAYLISDGIQQVEITSNDIAFTLNITPIVDAGINKVVKDNLSISPFSDAVFSDPDGSITKAEYKIDGEVDVWTEIPQGSFGTLTEAVHAFSYQFMNLGMLTARLQVTDNTLASNNVQADFLIVDVQPYVVTFNVQDIDGNHLSFLLVQQTASQGFVAQNSPFNLTFDFGIAPSEVIIKKDGWGLDVLFVPTSDHVENLIMRPGGSSLKFSDILPDVIAIPKNNPNMAEAMSFLYQYFRKRRKRDWWNMRRFIERG